MFKKKDKTVAVDGNNSDCKTVVTETVKTSGGVVQTTKTIVSSSGSKEDIESAFKNFNVDSSRSTASYVTKKVVYTTTSGQQQVTEEILETFENPDSKLKAIKGKDFIVKETKSSKPQTEKPSAKSKTKELSSDAKSSTKAPPSVKTGKFEDDCLKSHNDYRAKHGVPKLKLSKQMCAYSKEWADHLATTDSFKHRTERKYGENIYMKWSSDPNHAVAGHEAVDSWYSEIKDYTFGKEPTSLKSGHFTQVIWKESSELGVAWARSKSGKILVVANYSPAGNFVGRFTANVPPPKK